MWDDTNAALFPRTCELLHSAKARRNREIRSRSRRRRDLGEISRDSSPPRRGRRREAEGGGVGASSSPLPISSRRDVGEMSARCRDVGRAPAAGASGGGLLLVDGSEVDDRTALGRVQLCARGAPRHRLLLAAAPHLAPLPRAGAHRPPRPCRAGGVRAQRGRRAQALGRRKGDALRHVHPARGNTHTHTHAHTRAHNTPVLATAGHAATPTRRHTSFPPPRRATTPTRRATC